MMIPISVLVLAREGQNDTVTACGGRGMAIHLLHQHVTRKWSNVFIGDPMPLDRDIAIDTYFNEGETDESYSVTTCQVDVDLSGLQDNEVDLDEEEVNVVIAAIEATIDSCQKSLDHLITDPSERKDMEYAVSVLNTSYEKLKD